MHRNAAAFAPRSCLEKPIAQGGLALGRALAAVLAGAVLLVILLLPKRPALRASAPAQA